jgi:prepilin-type N-terminal cleavage/methylation domain-containing protein/prepilin-type processing-associated H-X9-DG protein
MTKRAFTLIELLVVIAIIAILMAILMPALRAAKDHARRIHCVANVKTLALAWFMYKDENDDRLVRGHTGATWQPDDWAHSAQNRQTLELKLEAIKTGALFPYVKDVGVYRCPADDRLRHPTQFCYRSFSIANGANGETGYPYPPRDHVPATKYSEIKRPGTKYVFVEDIDPRGENVGSWQMRFNPPSFTDPVAMWHNEKTTLGFADGHSEMHRWRDKSFIDWSHQAMYSTSSSSFSFDKDPEPGETEDIGFLARGFPCKSHK